jgi:2'-5' RNA ligase
MRYAVYFCPAPDNALGKFGRDWFATTSIPGITENRFRVLMADVWRYGWHATLSAPFELAGRADCEALQQKVARIAQSFAPFDLPLRVDLLSGFLALRPSADETHINALAERCVRDLNPLRAPVSNAAWDRRAGRLDEAERALFKEFGYPYVLDRFRFHMTLSAPATDAEEHALREYLLPKIAGHSIARIDALTICCEKEPGSDFEPVARIALGPGLAV